MSTEAIIVKQGPITTWERFNITLTPVRFRDPSITHRDIGGFYSARFDLETNDREEAIEWLNNGPGRHVEFYSEKGIVDFEGQIRRAQLDTGIAVVECDLRNMANSVFVRYQPVGGGATARSATVEDDLSIARWGRKVWVLAGGEVDAGVADQRAQLYLNSSYWAKPTLASLNQGGTINKILNINFVCVGYWQLLDYAVYNQTLIAGEADASTVVEQILTDAVVAQFVESYEIEQNTTQMTQEYDADLRPTSILEGICAYGDAQYNPYVAGFEAGRKFYYRQGAASRLPTT